MTDKAPTKPKRGRARAFDQDLANGEHKLGQGKKARAAAQAGKNPAPGHTAALGAEALTHGTAMRPYNAGGRAPGSKHTKPQADKLPGNFGPGSAIPGGRKGGGGAWIKSDGQRGNPDGYGAGRAAQDGSIAAARGGVMDAPDTQRDPQFYAKKRAAERALGRELSFEEFLASYYVPNDAPTAMGTSIFDPVLCELAYRWWCPPGGVVLDPFAGGSVRGVVAGVLGRRYVGIDLREEQVVANRIQAELIFDGRDPAAFPMPTWTAGDSSDVLFRDDLPGADEVDFVFSCPPYADLEVYSDDPRDLSTMAYDDFRRVYREIIDLACERLRPDRFACFVVGDVRAPDGCYRSFPQHTIEAFAAAGLQLYNDAILVTAAGSLPVRAGRQFAASRKLGTTHQRIQVFVKGNGARATAAVGPVEFGQGEGDEAETHESGTPPADPPGS